MSCALIASSATASAVAAAAAAAGTRHFYSQTNHPNHHVKQEIQFLVRLDQIKTFLITFFCHDYTHEDYQLQQQQQQQQQQQPHIVLPTKQQVIHQLSLQTGIPPHKLQIDNYHHPSNPNHTIFLSAKTKHQIRGGKGGFGTLLKGQSKQAGARKTLDFGACRDLNGRRLRHVNDEIKLRKWREMQQRRRNRDGSGSTSIQDEIEDLRTVSGIRNWHLMVPNWSEAAAGSSADGGGMSGKHKRSVEVGLKREVERWKGQTLREEEKRRREKEMFDLAVDAYANQGLDSFMGGGGDDLEDGNRRMSSAVLEGMKKRRKVKDGDVSSAVTVVSTAAASTIGQDKETSFDTMLESSSATATNLCTLSGDIVIEEEGDQNDKEEPFKTTTAAITDKNRKYTVFQSKSEFATAACILPSYRHLHPTQTTTAAATNENAENPKIQGIYYEVMIHTGGLAQIGWAQMKTNHSNDYSDRNDDFVGGNSTFSSVAAVHKQGFLPNSDTGDGVGDDDMSFGYDGSRGLVFHGGKEIPYCTSATATHENDEKQQQLWKQGDIIGCMYDLSNGTISYSINGNDFGTAFSAVGRKEFNTSNDDNDDSPLPYRNASQLELCPAFSLNENEILGLNIGPTFDYFPTKGDFQYTAVCELIGKYQQEKAVKDNANGDSHGSKEGPVTNATTSVPNDKLMTPSMGMVHGIILPPSSSASKKKSQTKHEEEQTMSGITEGTKKGETITAIKKASLSSASESTVTINFDEYQSAQELEQLGMDKLKAILLGLGCKCGGSLQERSKRLFSLKGLRRDEYPMKVRGKNFSV